MPGSCEEDQSSSSNLVSSLRKYRLKDRPKYTTSQSSSTTQSNTAEPSNNLINKSSSTESLNNLSQKSYSRNSSPSTSSSSSISQNYSPLGYRNYEVSRTSTFVLPCILTKLQQSLRKKNVLQDLDLTLTEDEYAKLKEVVLKVSNLSKNWKINVAESLSCVSGGTRELKLNRQYMTEIAKQIRCCILSSDALPQSPSQSETTPNNFRVVRTYSRPSKVTNPAASIPSKKPSPSAPLINNHSPSIDLPTVQSTTPTKGIMDEYEVFCEKEQNLRKLLDAFPGADIMEAQDILVRCNWDLNEAKRIAHTQPLRCSKKKALQHALSAANESPSLPATPQQPVSSVSAAEEIVLDSSDDELNNTVKNMNDKRVSETGRFPAAKRARKLMSSSDSEVESSSRNSILEIKPDSVPDVSPNHTPASEPQKTFSMSSSVTIEPVPVQSNVPSKEITTAVSNLPNMPKGLSITQLGSSSSAKLVANSEISVISEKKTVNMINQKSEVINIDAASTNRSAQLVHVQKTNNGLPSKNVAHNTAATVSPAIPKKISPSVCNLGTSTSSAVNKEVVSSIVSEPQKKEVVPEPQKGNYKTKNPKGKRKKYVPSDDEDDEYGNEDIYNSDDSDYECNFTAAHSAVLKFFQEASNEELACIPGCSKKKIEAITNLRPFSSWADLVQKLSNDKILSTDLLNGSKKVLDMRNAINKLMAKCQQISLDMEDLVENLKENKESSSDYVAKQPRLLNENLHLAPYQMLGLNWLLLLHNQEVNGILADEMGLGKTVQAISFLAYLKQIDSPGPHLIVVPSSTLDNWRQELQRWWPGISTLLYHGSQEARRELRFKIINDEVEEFDVMITTYNMVCSCSEDRGFFKRLEFHYVIFDEAHMLKNMASQRYQNLMRIRAPRRLLLTGTPLQNNLVELMSLLIFAMPHMFSGKTEQVKQMFSAVSKTDGNKNSYEKDRIEHAKRIMKPFVLRRLKREVLKDLPLKHDEIRYCSMVNDQAAKYQQLVEKFSAEVEKNKVDSSEKISSSGAGMMMQLRRAANHPLLLRKFYNDDKLLEMSNEIIKEPTHTQSDPNLVFEDMSVMSDFELHKLCQNFKTLKPYILPDDHILNSGKFKVLDELLPNLINEGHRILLFSQFTMILDIVEEYMHIKDYKYLRLDGQTPVVDRQEMIDEFNNDPTILIFLLSTKAGGLGINLTAADTVIIHDIDFNPYNDKQAEDRCHRVGQTRDVKVFRFISEHTIEEGILQAAKEKLKLEKDIHEDNDTDENDSANVAKLLRDALGLKNTKS